LILKKGYKRSVKPSVGNNIVDGSMFLLKGFVICLDLIICKRFLKELSRQVFAIIL
jgi:hypothetical protein